jgi:hypothetical protein
MYKAHLSIQKTSWNGFAFLTGKPPSLSDPPYPITVSEKETLDLKFAEHKYPLLIKTITSDSVELHTENLLVKNQNLGSRIRPEPYDLTLKLNDTETFHTPTLDAGVKWEITLSSIEPQTAATDTPPILKLPETNSKSASKTQIRIPKAYFSETQKLLKQLEEKLSTKIIVYYVSDKYDISNEHPDFFLEQLRDIGHQEKISLILYSSGGSWEAAMRIAGILRQFTQTFEVIVPGKCSSAATKLSLAADRILMTSNGFLTPVDTQHYFKLNQNNNLGTVNSTISADSVNRILDLLNKSHNPENGSAHDYEILLQYLHPTLLGDILRASRQSEQTGIKLMKMHPDSFNHDDEKISVIAKHLVYDYPSHTYPILFEEAKEIGLPVEKVDDETTFLLWDLLKLYKAITREAITFFHTSLYHVEETPIVIESTEKRVLKRYSFNQQYFITEKRWKTTHNNTQWTKLTPSGSKAKPYDITPIEAEETQIPTEVSR